MTEQTVVIKLGENGTEEVDTFLTKTQWDELPIEAREGIMQRAILNNFTAWAYLGEDYLGCV